VPTAGGEDVPRSKKGDSWKAADTPPPPPRSEATKAAAEEIAAVISAGVRAAARRNVVRSASAAVRCVAGSEAPWVLLQPASLDSADLHAEANLSGFQ
jgi:hypothetical protein